MKPKRTSAGPSPVLVALAARNPELDAIRWRVRLPSGTWENIAGEKIDTNDGSRAVFLLDDGTTRTFEPDEWLSAVSTPGTVEPVLDAIIRRLHAFGLADLDDILNQGSWLMAQPEWIEDERKHLAGDPAGLDAAEFAHYLHSEVL